MLKSNYIKIYTGNGILVQLMQQRLEAIGINPIIKDETESGRLAGFAASSIDMIEIHVHKNELDQAVKIIEIVRAEMEVN